MRIKRIGLGAMCAAVFSSAAPAQQFIEESTTRFPQPDPNEWTNQATVGDIDNDNDLDILFANGGNFSTPGTPQRVRIMVNNGSGIFTEESATRMASHTGLYRGVELGDIENDGDLDVILASDFNQRPRLFLNNGAGFFTDATTARLPANNASSPRAMFGDIDSDGDIDLYVCNGGTTNRFGCGQNYIFVNNGAGTFTDQTAFRHPAATLCEPQDVIFGDVDGDFDLDARTASTGTNQSRLLINNGSGFFTFVNTPSDANCYSYDFGDIEGDGDLDLYGANAHPSSINADLLLLNNGAGGYSDVSAQLSPNPNVDDNDSKFFDYDMDGDLDLFVARLGGTSERIYSNNGTGTFTQVSGLITPIGDSSLDIKVADFNNDGRPDIVTAQGESGSFRNRIYMNNGPQDTRAPRIIRTEQVSLVAVAAGAGPAPVRVRAAIDDQFTSDRGPILRGVKLAASVNGAPPVLSDMRWSGHEVYRGIIDPPAVACGQLVEYWVIATDWAGNVGTGPTLSFSMPGSPPQADLDGSGTVDSTDLNIVLTDFGCIASCTGDIDDDGDTDSTDLNILLATFGESCGAG